MEHRSIATAPPVKSLSDPSTASKSSSIVVTVIVAEKDGWLIINNEMNKNENIKRNCIILKHLNRLPIFILHTPYSKF